MPLSNDTIEELATVVDDAARHKEPIVMLTADHPEMTLDDAYTIQRRSMARRIERGESVVGMKMGLTSTAKMEQMNVHNPIYGHLTDSMMLPDGATIDRHNYCHPRVEAELAFVMSEDIQGEVGPRQALSAVEGVCAAIEIIDSRYKDFEFTLIDVVADNASSTGFAVGPVLKPAQALELGNLGMVMSINGEVVETGSSAAILEHPARSLAALITMLAERDEGLRAGQTVLAGSATKAVHINSGDRVELDVDTLGSVQLQVQ